MYEMCALKPPFDASSLHYLALKIVQGKFNPLPNHYSRELKSLVTKLLSTDANQRPNINELLGVPLLRNRIKNFLED